MKTKLTENEISALLPQIQRVLATGKTWKADLLHHPAGAIIDAVLSIPGVSKIDDDGDNGEGFSTNGWQWDWWQNFCYKGKSFTLSGSGYYGGHSFSVAD